MFNYLVKQTNKNNVILFVSIIFGTLFALSLLLSFNTYASGQRECVGDDRSGMSGSITVDGQNNTVDINITRDIEATGCASIGGAVYLIPPNGMPMAGLNDQKLFDYQDGILINPGETKMITLNLPEDNCRVQIDGFVGNVIKQFDYPNGGPKIGWYSSRLVTSQIDKELPFCEPTPSPTPTPTITPSTTPTVEVTPTPTVEVTPTPTPTAVITPTVTEEPTPTPTTAVLAAVTELPQTSDGYAVLGMIAGLTTAGGAALSEYLKRSVIK